MMRTSLATAAWIACLTAACGSGYPEGDDPLTGPWHAVEERIGDTLVIRTVSGSEWGTARLVEELRIGVVEGSEHEMFGQVGALAVLLGGEVLVYDAQATAIRRFDAGGAYLGAIGGAGSGPGEYTNVTGLAVLDDGRIVANDFGNGRFNVYAWDGNLLDTWLVQPAIAVRRPVPVDGRGGVFLHDLRAGDHVLIRITGSGSPQDTIPIPYPDYQSPGLEVRVGTISIGARIPFTAERSWAVTSDGEVVATIGNRYAVDVHLADGTVRRITKAFDPVPVSAEERAAEEERVTRSFQREIPGWRWDGPGIPANKPPISSVRSGSDRTIWVTTAQPGTALPEEERTQDARTFVVEPLVFDVFRTDGRFLGQVAAPPGFQIQPHPVFGPEHVWAVVHGDHDVQFVARYRIERRGNHEGVTVEPDDG
jgi:hypothetical protein